MLEISIIFLIIVTVWNARDISYLKKKDVLQDRLNEQSVEVEGSLVKSVIDHKNRIEVLENGREKEDKQ
ncbi:hypothetical protein SAMN02745163_02074 [Clostridium cavendishii DSM 21758]|uniref:BhlA holin family protein n=1 Tax=Clostridium cavendishii DSM 21758 TaxID=1121302 RepID=A0A1M6K1Y6_9CLOT|nr:hypothetical protein [Clostridium cavendishii]SHJ52872.1 hypothetical protein SAMN02745163_02074 [Clostridium cavendishii DSM 21758]